MIDYVNRPPKRLIGQPSRPVWDVVALGGVMLLCFATLLLVGV